MLWSQIWLIMSNKCFITQTQAGSLTCPVPPSQLPRASFSISVSESDPDLWHQCYQTVLVWLQIQSDERKHRTTTIRITTLSFQTPQSRFSSDTRTFGAGTKTKVFADDVEENKDDKDPVLCFSGNRLLDTWPTV